MAKINIGLQILGIHSQRTKFRTTAPQLPPPTERPAPITPTPAFQVRRQHARAKQLQLRPRLRRTARRRRFPSSTVDWMWIHAQSNWAANNNYCHPVHHCLDVTSPPLYPVPGFPPSSLHLFVMPVDVILEVTFKTPSDGTSIPPWQCLCSLLTSAAVCCSTLPHSRHRLGPIHRDTVQKNCHRTPNHSHQRHLH